MIKIAVLGASEIAHRMFLPALLQNNNFECVAVAANQYDSEEKVSTFVKDYGVRVIKSDDSFEKVIMDKNIDAVYVPQPPALHYKWASLALKNNKHVFVEKPSTDCLMSSEDLVRLARQNSLALHENYMFQYHSQLDTIKEIISNGKLGDLRLIKASFGFPMRTQNDFRYNKNLGGGALLDAGGYVLRLASVLLGDTIKIDTASKGDIDGFEVDMFGAFTASNKDGLVFQGSYGMDCYYQCCLEIWGSKAKLSTGRIFTAPTNYEPIVVIETAEGREEIKLSSDMHFAKSLKVFENAILDTEKREREYHDIILQSSLVETVRNMWSKND